MPCLHRTSRNLLVELLAFAALGTIADVVPLVGENRVIARFGLVRAKHSSFIGLRALVEASGLSGEEIGAMEVGFRLGPRLNAAGRMGDAKDAVELLRRPRPPAPRRSPHISKQNEQPAAVQQDILNLAIEMAEQQGDLLRPGAPSSSLTNPGMPGVVGIVCSQLVERFHRPTILMQKRDARVLRLGPLHRRLQSARRACPLRPSISTNTAGTPWPRVFTSSSPSSARSPAAFTEYANAAIDADMLAPASPSTAKAAPRELTPDCVRTLQNIGPFGAWQPRPAFSCAISSSPTAAPSGANGKHLSVSLPRRERTRTGPRLPLSRVSSGRTHRLGRHRHAPRRGHRSAHLRPSPARRRSSPRSATSPSSSPHRISYHRPSGDAPRRVLTAIFVNPTAS